MANLANTYRDQSRLDDAVVLQEAVKERRKRVLGDDHPDTLKSMECLATTYKDLGRLNDAGALEAVLAEKTK